MAGAAQGLHSRNAYVIRDAQVEVGHSNTGSVRPFDDGVLERFQHCWGHLAVSRGNLLVMMQFHYPLQPGSPACW